MNPSTRTLLEDLLVGMRGYLAMQTEVNNANRYATAELIERIQVELGDSMQYVSEGLRPLIEAHRQGAQIQVRIKRTGEWADIGDPSWDCAPECYRIKSQGETA